MASDPDPRPDSRAPDGAHCAEHPERTAHFTCPRCGSYACVACFHPSIERCHQCIKRDPTEAAAPLPWERADASPARRYLGTLASAFHPVRSAPAFARDDVSAARRFLLVSALPLALLAGVVPHTRTLLFEGGLQVRVLGSPSSFEIALDIVRAMGVQLAWSATELGCLLLPFVSLVRAYAPARKAAAVRVLYYRFWLLPAALLVFYLAVTSLPAPATPEAEPAPAGHLLVFALRTLIPVLLFLAMGATARLACGLGPWLSMVVVIVPVILMLVVSPLLAVATEQVLPQLERPPSELAG